jgi:hypothetical protein
MTPSDQQMTEVQLKTRARTAKFLKIFHLIQKLYFDAVWGHPHTCKKILVTDLTESNLLARDCKFVRQYLEEYVI